MYMLEIIDEPNGNETIHFTSASKVLDYVYMVEGEGLIPEIRSEYQRTAPNDVILTQLNKSNGAYFWTAGRVRYVVSYTRWPWVGGKRIKYCPVPVSTHYYAKVS